MKQIKLNFLSVAIVFIALVFASCHKAQKPNTEIDFYNDTYTPVNITVNGTSAVIGVGDYLAFTGTAGSTAEVTASTANYSASNTQVGITINWNFSDVFPSNGSQNDYIDVPSEYFFLQITNNNFSNNIGQEYVNYGLPDQTLDNVLIPNNGQIYNVGYYDAWSTSNVKLISTSGSVVWSYPISLPFTSNQNYNFVAN